MDIIKNNDAFIPIIFYIDYINIEYNKYLNKHFKGITPRDFTYLLNIYYHKNSSQRELADLMIVSEANAGQIIRRLEKNNLVKRDLYENNKSTRIISLTEEGLSHVLALLQVSKDWETKFFENYDAGEKEKFKEMISDYYQKSINEI